jgi:hypothetical protein
VSEDRQLLVRIFSELAEIKAALNRQLDVLDAVEHIKASLVEQRELIYTIEKLCGRWKEELDAAQKNGTPLPAIDDVRVKAEKVH